MVELLGHNNLSITLKMPRASRPCYHAIFTVFAKIRSELYSDVSGVSLKHRYENCTRMCNLHTCAVTAACPRCFDGQGLGMGNSLKKHMLMRKA